MKTRRITLFGIPFDTVSAEQAVLKLHYYSQLSQGEQKICVTPNPEMIVEATRNKDFYNILRNADFSLPDGSGIVWASGFLPLSKLDLPYFFHKKLKLKTLWEGMKSLFFFAFKRKEFSSEIQERVTGTDIFGRFLATSQSKIFLLGGKKGAAEQLANNFAAVVGYYDGPVTAETNGKIIDFINASGADVLFVALGAPKQEFWIAENLPHTPTIRFSMGVGGAFDFLTGFQKRAPETMQKMGLEWLYRLFKEPSRWKRIWKATVEFFLLTVRERSQRQHFETSS